MCGSKLHADKMAQGYVPDANGNLVATPDIEMSWAFSAGDLCATTGDMLKWNKALHRGSLLKDYAYSIMTSPAVMSDGTPTTYGTGLFIDEFQGHRHFEHGGDTLTFASQTAFYPDDDLTIVILTNTEGHFDRFALERDLGRQVLGLEAIPVAPTLPLAQNFATQVTGSYNILGRPVSISVMNNQAQLTDQGRSMPIPYQGAGRFNISSATAQIYLVFPMADGNEAFFNLFVYEMLVARGMRSDSMMVMAARRSARWRPPLQEFWLW